MRALQYRRSVPRYVLVKALRALKPRLRAPSLAPLSLVDVAEPRLPADSWVRVRPILSGICGSDLATIAATGSPYLAPVTSMPFIMGHEVVGTVIETGDQVSRVATGDRVVLHPALGCKARCIEPPCESCRGGRDALCRNIMDGCVSSGIQTGFCRDTGGGFGDQLVAHESQLYRVPESLSDAAAVLIEPFACAVHGALRKKAAKSESVLVIGCGAIGLLTIAALRATGCHSRILATARYDHQRAHALSLGADEIIDSPRSVSRRYQAWGAALSAKVLKGEIGRPTVIGGADVTIDCVASSDSINDGIRFTKSGGSYVLVGMPGIPTGVDWTPLWYQELDLHSAYAYGPERMADGVRETFDLSIDLMVDRAKELEPLVGSPYPLAEYRAALSDAMFTGRSGVVKTVICN